MLRFAIDTGGTFTDLLVEDERGRLRLYKVPTQPADPVAGALAVLNVAADDLGLERRDLLGRADLLVHGTTIGTNAVLTGRTAKTAFLTTAGHPDVLVLREAGRAGLPMFDFSIPYPESYISRALTFEVPERIGADGRIIRPLDEAAVLSIAARLAELAVEAVGVCFLWSIANPRHELLVGELLARQLPGVPVTLSHAVNPSLREYRRASSACIDASLKPLMTSYLSGLERRLREAGFGGRVLVVTSQGGVMDATEMARVPIHAVKSGPAMAPVAGRRYAAIEGAVEAAIVADSGGTSYDVSLIRAGRIPWTRETWIGRPHLGHMTGFPSVDVRSIGAGGGSLAAVDDAGLLRVGPHSAGAMPGPACYGRGGDKPTVTDAGVVLGYFDPDYFNGGRMTLDAAAAHRVIETLAGEIGRSPRDTAFAIITIANELMIKAIHEITVSEGLNPRESVIVAGGGAAGLNIMPIARELGCQTTILPKTASAMSACGMQYSDIVFEQTRSRVTMSGSFDLDGVNKALAEIDEKLEEFRRDLHGAERAQYRKEYFAEARYKSQVWELDTPLPVKRFRTAKDVAALVEAFHTVHDRVYAVRDEQSEVECVNWRGRMSIRLSRPAKAAGNKVGRHKPKPWMTRQAYFGGESLRKTPVFRGIELKPGAAIAGPAIIEEPTTTIVVYPRMSAFVSPSGHYILKS
jgi:N-methylhydantoinase A